MSLLDLFTHKYPSTDFHELNLDWCISAILELQKSFKSFSAANKLLFANPLQHDLTKTYAKNTIVVDDYGNAWLSLQVVPKGVQLSNTDYWLEVFNFEAYTSRANRNFTDNYFVNTDRAPYPISLGDWMVLDDVLYKATAAIATDDLFVIDGNIVHFTVEQFLKDFVTSVNTTLNDWYNQMTGTINQYKNDIDASELAYRNQLAQDIANTTASLQAQLDAAISGATVDSEVINARVGWNSYTYPTLGDAVRGQIGDIHNEQHGLSCIPILRGLWASSSAIASAGTGNYSILCVKPNTLYRIKRKKDGSFGVAMTATYPTVNTAVTNRYIIEKDATFWTDSTTKFVFITWITSPSPLTDAEKAIELEDAEIYELDTKNVTPIGFIFNGLWSTGAAIVTQAQGNYSFCAVKPNTTYEWQRVDTSDCAIAETENFPVNGEPVIIRHLGASPKRFKTSATTNWLFFNEIVGSSVTDEQKAAALNGQILVEVPDLDMEQHTYIVDINGSAGSYSTSLTATIIEATKYMNSVIYVLDGTYDLVAERIAISGESYFTSPAGNIGIVLKNNVHIIFSSASKVVCDVSGYDSVEPHVDTYFAPFNAGIPYGFTLENLTIESVHTRYCIHDELGSTTKRYTNKYLNCNMKHTPRSYNQCIGGGLGQAGEIIIKDCVFYSTVSIWDVSYHNNGTGTVSKSRIVMSGCYLGTTFKAGYYGMSTAVTDCILSNNSFDRVPVLKSEDDVTEGRPVNMQLIAWNNVIRE